MRSLFLIGRHGETFLNIQGNFRGWSNGPDARLSEEGIKSAREAGAFLAETGQKFSKIICSPLDRAKVTAAIIAGYIGIKNLQLDDRLLPLNVGDLAGKPKADNPIDDYLKNKDKRFPNGETVNEFEERQQDFADDLLDIVESHKYEDDDSEILVLAHTSNSMFWWNLHRSKNSEEYLNESADILLPGGLAMVTDHATIPIFRANEVAKAEGNVEMVSQIPNFTLPADHKPGMRVPKGGSSCASCKFVSEDKLRCSNEYFIKWNGSDVLPAPADEYCTDWYETK